MLKEIIVSIDPHETRAAVLEDNNLVEIYIERHRQHAKVGNIYAGRVKDVLPGMEAAFVEIGEPKNAFLYVHDIFPQEYDEDTPELKIKRVIKPRQKVLVQVSKEAIATKGARLTMQPTLAGRHIVLLPQSDFIGVSKKIDDDNTRELMRNIGEEICPPGFGIILRTVAAESEREQLVREIRYLSTQWAEIETRFVDASPPQLIFEEPGLSLRMARDVLNDEYDFYITDSRAVEQRVTAFLSEVDPGLVPKVRFYDEKLPLFERFNIEGQIQDALKRRVWLRSGGYITIDHTEALTAIDVNTGKYVGKTSLEETILQTNLEATAEIVRQIRLRDIGGIIVIDFIDMEVPEHREEVFAEFEKNLARDRTKTHLIEISKLGLLEMTRKKVAEGLLQSLSEQCPRCGGLGLVPSIDTIAIDIERKIRLRCAAHEAQAFKFRVSEAIAARLQVGSKPIIKRIEEETGKYVILMPDSYAEIDAFDVLEEGELKDVT